QIRTLLREHLALPTGIQIKKTRSINMPGILALPAGDQIELSCPSCLYGQQQAINVNILGFDGSKQSFTASIDFTKTVKAYRILSALPSFSSIDTTVLKEEYVDSIPHTDLITDVENLKFYKTNKPIKAGELIRRSDLNAINLVKAGLKTDVVLENQMIR